jgi:hypothetical protein
MLFAGRRIAPHRRAVTVESTTTRLPEHVQGTFLQTKKLSSAPDQRLISDQELKSKEHTRAGNKLKNSVRRSIMSQLPSSKPNYQLFKK